MIKRALSTREICRVFNRAFGLAHQTMLVGGAAEPLYEPATPHIPALLQFREDFAASALHEVAHWCIAGAKRRRRIDFGYEYIAPPRSAFMQAKFFAAEMHAQSLEAEFCAAAGVVFRVSVDDLVGGHTDAGHLEARRKFEKAMQQAKPGLRQWLRSSAGERAQQMLNGLHSRRRNLDLV